MELPSVADHTDAAGDGLTQAAGHIGTVGADAAADAGQGLMTAADHMSGLGFENALTGLWTAIGHTAGQAMSMIQAIIDMIMALLGVQ
ncbi:MAG: hypothetical protein V3T70_10130 [Phycisphaerae bacterium]